MASLLYPLTVRVFYRDLTFDTTAAEIAPSVTGITYPQRITLYENKIDYILRLENVIYIIDNSESNRRPDMKNDTDHVVLTGRRPNGDIISIENLTYAPTDKIGLNHHIVDINGDPKITSVLGKTEYLIQFYTAENELICSGRFDVTIVSASGIPLLKKRIVLGLHNKRVPPTVHISQHDTNVRLIVDMDFGDASFKPTTHIENGVIKTHVNTSYIRYFLEGVRPDNQFVSLIGTLSSSTDSFYSATNKTNYSIAFNLTNDFTDIIGRTTCRIYFFYGSAVYYVDKKITVYTPYSELYSMPFYIDIEPAP